MCAYALITKQEVSMINFTFFDVADAVLENLIGPVFILLIKFLVSQLLSLLCFCFCAYYIYAHSLLLVDGPKPGTCH